MPQLVTLDYLATTTFLQVSLFPDQYNTLFIKWKCATQLITLSMMSSRSLHLSNSCCGSTKCTIGRRTRVLSSVFTMIFSVFIVSISITPAALKVKHDFELPAGNHVIYCYTATQPKTVLNDTVDMNILPHRVRTLDDERLDTYLKTRWPLKSWTHHFDVASFIILLWYRPNYSCLRFRYQPHLVILGEFEPSSHIYPAHDDFSLKPSSSNLNLYLYSMCSWKIVYCNWYSMG